MPIYPSPRRTIPPFDPEVDRVLNNQTATAAPTVNDDMYSGYAISSKWINLVTKSAYICVDNVPTSASWLQVGSSGSSTNQVVEDLSTQADGITTTFILSAAATISTILVTRRGQVLRNTVDYTILSSTQVDFTTAPYSGDTVVIIYVPA